MNTSFNYNLPVNLLFGRGRIAEIGIQTRRYGRRAMIVTGTSTNKTGLLARTLQLLSQAGLEQIVFDQVSQNPLTTTAVIGAQMAVAEGCDVIIGLGGGSVMDCAKAIAFLAYNEGDINDYIFGMQIGNTALPLVLVPTTCGTGSEGNCFAVLTNPENGDKKSLRTNAIIADVSLIDPALMETMPKGVLASVGFDALCHLMEAYISKSAQPMTDMMCREGIRLIGAHLLRLYEDAGEPADWDAVTWASTLGGMVIHTAGVTLPHAMEHPASGLRDIVHGRGLAALTPVITEVSLDGAAEKYGQISQLLGGQGTEDCSTQLRLLLSALKLNMRLSEQGIQLGDLPWMAENCLKVSGVSVKNHPVFFSQEEILGLYERAY